MDGVVLGQFVERKDAAREADDEHVAALVELGGGHLGVLVEVVLRLQSPRLRLLATHPAEERAVAGDRVNLPPEVSRGA